MNKARFKHKVYSNSGSVPFECNGGSFTNRGTGLVTIQGNIVLGQNESFEVPVIDAMTRYDQDFEITFSESGSRKLVVQQIDITTSNNC